VKRSQKIAAGCIAGVAVIAAGVGIQLATQSPAPSPPGVYTSSMVPTPTTVPSLCHSINGRADHTCSPGLFAHRPEVAADAPRYLHTLCMPGWTKTIRPPTTVTNKWKVQVMNAYGMRNVALKDVEGDHIGPLVLDGDDGSTLGPTGLPLNYYPELWDGPTGAHVKDQEEDLLHRQVCSGALTLQQAQDKIIRDWVK
jgi:hypothetical protein